MISKNAFFLCQKRGEGGGGGGNITPLLQLLHSPTLFVCVPYMLICSNFILFIFLCKYNCKVYHKSKSNYRQLTNKRKNHLNRGEQRYIRSYLWNYECKSWWKMRSLLANTGDLAYMEELLIIITASSIFDVGRGPGSVWDIFCIGY